MARLFMVATPIGNLSDISLRALETLKAVDTIACEDTRHSLKLLSHYEIHKPLVTCHAFREEEGSARILKLLGEGKDVAYVSDAGTPGLSDPGALAAREARAAGHEVIPIPGPSAFATILSVAGPIGKAITFEGFLSPKSGRRRSRISELLATGDAFCLYESPFRVLKLLEDIADLGGERIVVLGRELTKIHEEVLEGPAAELAENLRARDKILGEFALLVSGAKKVKDIE
jgi:16S rRNA (cytidine1402-2'-O)-methyltransferase